MYKITTATYNKFATELFIPVVPDANVTSNAVSGAIDVIVPVDANGTIVSSTGSGYDNYYSGNLTPTSVTNSSTPLVKLDSDASTRNDFYTGCYFYVNGGKGSGQYKAITGHVANSSGIFITLRSQLTTVPDDGSSTYLIAPGVVVRGAGDDYVDETGAADANIPVNQVSAIALVNANTGNSIYRVEVLPIGRAVNVHFASAYVNVSAQVGVSNTAILRVITGPKGGHGSNAAAELYSSSVGIGITFANTDTIPFFNGIQTVGLLVNPKVANVQFTTSNVNGTFAIGETVTQTIGSNTSTAIVTSISPLQVTNATPNFVTSTNSTVGTITGGTSSANAQINAISVSGITKGFGTFQQLFVYNGSYTGVPFTAGEIVYQGATAISNTSATQADIGLLDNSSARFHSNTADGQTVYLTSKLGRINSSNTITGVSSGYVFSISTKAEPDLVPESGTVLYIENFDKVNRSNTTSESIKLILSY
jgi:hypothetical protein